MKVKNFVIYFIVFSVFLVTLGALYEFSPVPLAGQSISSLATNSPPDTVVPSINTTPSVNWASDAINCYATVTDPDGDALQVFFYLFRNGSHLFNTQLSFNYPSGGLFTFNYPMTKVGEVYRCSIRVYDGQAYSPWMNSSELTIGAKSQNQTCSDGTSYGACSTTKPKYCSNGTFIDKCQTCGCPSGLSCNATSNSCYAPKTNQTVAKNCSDGTLYGKCSSSQPLYCSNGNLVNDCSSCGCQAGKSCDSSTQKCISPATKLTVVPGNDLLAGNENTGSSMFNESGLLMPSNAGELVKDRYIVEFKDEPVASKQVELEHEVDELREQANALRAEARALSGLIKTTRVTQANYIDSVAQNNEKGLAVQLSKYRQTLIANQGAAVNDINNRVAARDEFKLLAKYTNVFNGAVLALSETDLDSVRNSPYIKSVQQDSVVTAFLNGSVPRVGATEMWKTPDSNGQNITGKGIRVAIIDTGIDYTHPDLGGCLGPSCKVVGGYDFANNDTDPMDDYGHGTHVAGIVAANGVLKGVAPDAKLYAYKVLNSQGWGFSSDIIRAMDTALDPNGDGNLSDHVDIISMSLGGPGQLGDASTKAVKRAVDAGVAVVVAAGNDGPAFGTVASPGLAPEAITVGATCKPGVVNKHCYDNVLAVFSSRGVANELMIKPDVSAPGVEIYSSVPKSGCNPTVNNMCSASGYRYASGTSMATPHVAGAAALLKQAHPNWTPTMIKSALVTGATPMIEPMWSTGAGEIYVPNSSKADVFLPNSLFLGLANGLPQNITLYNNGQAASFIATSQDRLSLYPNMSQRLSALPNLPVDRSTVSSPISALAMNNFTATLSIAVSSPDDPGGYYDGHVFLKDGNREARIPFAYLDLARLNVHVVNKWNREISDTQGSVFLFNRPNASIFKLCRATPSQPCIPTSFLVSPGNYSVHALGNMYLYDGYYHGWYPYILSKEITIPHGTETADVYLSVANASEFTLNLTTPDGYPIYAKEFMIYSRSVYVKSIIGSNFTWFLSLPKSPSVYISDTDSRTGVSVIGFSYSADMLDFMSRNNDHWRERIKPNTTVFGIEATADQVYLLLWDFNQVNSSTPRILGLNTSKLSTFSNKYDVPGAIYTVWGAEGTHASIGAHGTPDIIRSVYTALNPFFSSITKTVFVQGVFQELYWPENIENNIFVWPEYYIPDYSHTKKASDIEDVYLPDRNFLVPIEGVSESVRIGAGPFWPSVRTMNNASALVILHPLLRDQGGARVATPATPYLYLYQNGAPLPPIDLIEHLGEPMPIRVVPLYGGSYRALITQPIASDISTTAFTILGFSTFSSDMNPPAITGLSMPQRFVPGEPIRLTLSATDDSAIANVSIWWRSFDSVAWQNLAVASLGAGNYGASIQTNASLEAVDLRFNVTDTAGNYIEYKTTNASKKQIPVLFDLSLEPRDVSYVNGNASVVVTGHLTDSNGKPLSSKNSIPIDIMLNGRKMAIILDDYNAGSRVHNGTIRFDWVLNPARLFSGPNQNIVLNANFDLGIYQPINKTLTLHSVESGSKFCSDGTPWGQCSSSKPLYCNLGSLVANCTNCGCPSGQNCNSTSNACYVPIIPKNCADGTQHGACSITKPKYCDNGNLVDRCGSPNYCGCPIGLSCNATTNSCSSPAPSNAPPTQPTMFLTSTLGTNTTNEDLTCYGEANDADNDVMNATMNWYANNILLWTIKQNNISTSQMFSYVLKAGNTSTGEVWKCNAMLTDGKANSTMGYSNTLLILAPPGQNNPPINPGPAINSSDGSNTVASNLNCYDTIMDLDGDRINVSLSWFRNGKLNLSKTIANQTSGTFINDVLMAPNLTLGDTWQCSMRLYDGKNYTSWANSSNLTVVVPPVTQPPGGTSPGGTAPGGSAPGGSAPGGTTQPPKNVTCANKLEITIADNIIVPQRVTKDVNMVVKNTGNCPLPSLAAALTLPMGWKANTYQLADGLAINESQGISITVVPPDIGTGTYSAILKFDAPGLSTAKQVKMQVVENLPYEVVMTEVPIAERVFTYVVFLLIVEFGVGAVIILIWEKPRKKLPPMLPLSALPPMEPRE